MAMQLSPFEYFFDGYKIDFAIFFIFVDARLKDSVIDYRE
jgi:hypothetical protein